MDEKIRKATFRSQCDELTEHMIYSHLATRSTGKNRIVLERIAKDELRHAAFWKGMTGKTAAPRRLRVWWYLFLAKVFGVIFAVKLMEGGEEDAQENYALLNGVRGVDALIKDEHSHEADLLELLREERLEYAGSIVLGLNDALVELTGALAGLTLALQDSRVVALAGLVTGIAASLSMAASGYLSSKEEGEKGNKSPLKSALYTGVAYIVTVLFLVAPYFIFGSIFVSLGVTLCLAVIIVAGYTFYITTAKSLRFWPRFLEMAIISLAVAAISFGVGLLLRAVLGIEA